MSTKLHFRAATDSKSDMNFVLKSFLNSSFDTNAYIPRSVHNDRKTKLMSQLLHRGAQLAIISLESDSDTYLAWVLYEKLTNITVIHQIYVKPKLRYLGISRGILSFLKINPEEDILYITHTSRALRQIKRKHKNLKLINVPELIEGM